LSSPNYIDPTRVGSGQIYYKNLDSNSLDFASAKIYLNLFNPQFEPKQIFMITYDNVLPVFTISTSMTSFQIYLSTDFVKSFVTFKFNSCPMDLFYDSSPGLNYKRTDGSFKEVKIFDGQQCFGSNVGQRGVWVSEVTTKGKLMHFFNLLREKVSKILRTWNLGGGGSAYRLGTNFFGSPIHFQALEDLF
jgi:hypothetical protein